MPLLKNILVWITIFVVGYFIVDRFIDLYPYSLVLIQVNEKIVLQKNEAFAQGTLTYSNSSSIRRSRDLYFPFGNFQNEDPPTNIKLSREKTALLEGTDFQMFHDGFILHLTLEPQQTTHIDFSYSRKIYGSEFHHILTSGFGWGNPIKDLSFAIEMPLIFKAVQITPQPDTMTKTNKIQFYEYTNHKAVNRGITVKWEEKT